MKTLIKNAKVLDARIDGQVLDVLISDQTIEAVAPELEAKDAAVLDFTGKTLMPAFIDSHVHVVSHNIPQEDMIRAFALNGVAAVRDMGILGNMDLEPYIRWLDAHRTSAYTQVVTAGRYIDVEGGYGMGPDPSMAWGLKIATPEEGVDMVRYEFSAGTDGLKLGLQDGFLGPVAGKMSPEMIRVMIREAESHDMWTTAHIGRVSDLQTIVDCGIGSAAHTPQDGIMDDRLIGSMVEKDISMTTTVGDPEGHVASMPFVPPMFKDRSEYLDWKLKGRDTVLENLRRFHEAGGTILVGTDLMHLTDARKDAAIPTRELRYLRSIGMTAREVIAAGTVNNAAACGISYLGLVKPGMRACLLGFEGDLDEGFVKLERPPFVMNQGAVLINELAAE